MTETPSTPPPTPTPDQQRPVIPVPPQSVTVYQRRGPNTTGCILTLLVALLVAVGLIAVGLFLPPFNLAEKLLGPQYAMLDASANAVAVDGLTLALDPDEVGRDFGVALSSIPREAFESGDESAGDSVRSAKAAVPGSLSVVGPVYTIATTGTPPESATLDIALPSGTEVEFIDIYGYDVQMGRWRFLPSQPTTAGTLSVTVGELPDHVALFQAGPVDPVVIVPVDITQELTSEAAQLATMVSPTGLTPNAAGQLVGSLAPGAALSAGYRVLPLIRNFDNPRAVDVGTVQGLISSTGGRRAHIEQLVALAISNSFDGVFIDYRGLPSGARDEFSAFIAELKQAFSSNGLLLGVVVPPAVNQAGEWQTGAYDWRAIGAAADVVQIDFGLDPLAFAPGPDRLVEAMLRWGTREVSRYKLVAGLNALSLREVGGVFAPVTYREALGKLGNAVIDAPRSRSGSVEPGQVIRARLDGLTAQPGVEAGVQTPYILYQNSDGTTAEKVWLTTPDALRFRLDRLTMLNVGGVALADLTSGGLIEGLTEAVLTYKLGLPASPAPNDIALRWRVQDSTGAVLSEVVTGLNEELVVTLEAVEGNVAVNVEVIGGESSSIARSGVQVAVLRPTVTPTPLPTATPTFAPTATPTLQTIIATNTAQPSFSGGGGSAVNPGPGSIAVGSFEYGGQVTSVDSQAAISALRQAGMTWMKIQVHYTPGNDPASTGAQVQKAKSHGFKIMISAIGNPSDLAAGGGGYIQQYASWLAGVASYGADAIEVWNEPNIDREWPAGQISGANYAAMLGAAYSAIKGSSPGTMVISAAPAPTGAEAAYPGQVRNDDAWLQELVNAGGLNMLDCVGIHYNEGIVSPNATSGDPRDNFYTRYFWSMVNLYWGITGGQKPLCFTELGYLTPEGYGAALASNFAWGANTSVAQHAAYLAEAIALASQSGQVRLLIVWNVDFSRYDGNDPQGGFAMVRPDGGCPACAAIAGAR